MDGERTLTSPTPRRPMPGRSGNGLALGRVVTLALVAALSWGCGSASEDPDLRSTMTVLVVGSAAAQMRLYELKYLLFLPLGRQDGLETIPALAQSWEHSPAGRCAVARRRARNGARRGVQP